MKVEPGRLYGVVSGDVVGSSQLAKDDRSALFQHMADASAELQAWLGDAVPLAVDVFSGDSWQLLVVDPELSLAAALFYRAYLRACPSSADTRLSIAIATIDFVPGDAVSEGDGEAFRRSGRLLREGLGKRRMGFAAENKQGEDRWDLVCELLDALITSAWTDKRSLAVTGALRGWRQEDIGKLWDPPIDQATIARHLKEAGWPAISRVIHDFERNWSIDN